MPVRLTIESAQMAAALRGGQCLSKEYVNRDTKLLWRCSEGHEWWARTQHIRRGNAWCPYCSNKVLLTIEDAHRIAQDKGGQCLSETLVVGEKVLWRCGKGHTWKAHLSNVKTRTWCPTCAGKHYTIEEMQDLAKSKGGRCLSPNYTPRLLWQCAKGHTWYQSHAIIKAGSWCPGCAGRQGTLKDMQDLAASKNGLCLSTEYHGTMRNLTWQCAKGHTWEATPLNVRRTSWCPQCKVNKSERFCRKVLESLFGEPFPKSRPSWLRNSKGNQMELDGYCEAKQVAFEFQGFQHYSLGFLHRTQEDFVWQQQRDQEKRDLCAKHGVFLLEIPWDVKDKPTYIQNHVSHLVMAQEKDLNPEVVY